MTENEDCGFDDLFAAEDAPSETEETPKDTWKILIVDDEEGIHQVIKLALTDFTFQGKTIRFIDAYSGKEAEEVLKNNPDIAVVLLDVVMETDHAGLNFVKYIRDQLKNQFIRIVLWTGQPGQAPRKEVVLSYEINDYKSKADMTDENIFTAVLSSIRAYNAMMTVESYRLHLSEMVEERTKTIEAQKEKITDSINYAKKIQMSMLPSEQLIKKYFPDSFIFYRPKDIVSGDFYWFSEAVYEENGAKKSKVFLAAADCTGHGVPGAFMSMIGNTLLNEIVNSKGVYAPSEILKQLNQGVIDGLNQRSDKEDAQNDGMDITLCAFNKDEGILEIACANHVVFVVDDSGINMIDGDIFSIGGIFSVLREPEYTNHVLTINQSTTIYMFSDGFQDQFGGADNEKFMLTRFKNLLYDIRNEDMASQMKIVEKTFDTWKGDGRQIDDILVMGIKLNQPAK